MTTDFRALCAALLDEIPHESPTTCLARAALAQSEPEGPSDEGRNVADYMRSEIDVVESCAGFTDESTPVGEAWSQILGAMERSRYGTATPAPVPVSERPWEREGWCDAKGQCWMADGGGNLPRIPGGFVRSWRLCRPCYSSAAWSLPHHAMPVPEVTP